MRFLTVKLLAATALSLTLAACVPATTLTSVAPTQPPIPTDNTMHYVGVVDDGFNVPTVPVEKVPAAYQVQQVDYTSAEAAGTIIINPAERHLYYINGKNTALRYGIAVGRAGFQWAGVANITSRTHWPKWTPPAEMIERSPEKAKWKDGMPGGPENPLGARALYLTTNGVDYGYRIHGTPEWFSIGKNASSGCIRMINQDVMDLYNRVQDGAKVVVLNADGTYPEKLKLPPPAPKKKKPEPAPAPVEAVAPVLSATPNVLPGATTLPSATLPSATLPSATLPAKPIDPAASTVPATTMATDPAVTTAPATTTAPAATVPIAAAPTATAPVTVTPAATTPAATTPATAAVCSVPLVNGLCPKP